MIIEVIGKNNCTYCNQTKVLLETKKINYKYTNSSELPSDQVAQLINEKAPNARTFPIILIDNVYVGGFTEIKNLV